MFSQFPYLRITAALTTIKGVAAVKVLNMRPCCRQSTSYPGYVFTNEPILL